MPERIWLLRHAETATPHLFHGAESDVGLSDRGRLQADALADWFAAMPPESRPTAAVSSCMRRAVATEAPIDKRLGFPGGACALLHERRVGELSGRGFADAEPHWRGTLDHWIAGDTAYTTPGAESYDGLRARVLDGWKSVTDYFDGERLVVVAHGIVCKVLLLELTGRGPAGWEGLGKVPNCAVSTLVPTATGWEVTQLLTVPAPVLAVSGGVPTGLGQVRQP